MYIDVKVGGNPILTSDFALEFGWFIVSGISCINRPVTLRFWLLTPTRMHSQTGLFRVCVCARARVCVCVFVCVRACVRACARVRVYVWICPSKLENAFVVQFSRCELTSLAYFVYCIDLVCLLRVTVTERLVNVLVFISLLSISSLCTQLAKCQSQGSIFSSVHTLSALGSRTVRSGPFAFRTVLPPNGPEVSVERTNGASLRRGVGGGKAQTVRG